MTGHRSRHTLWPSHVLNTIRGPSLVGSSGAGSAPTSRCAGTRRIWWRRLPSQQIPRTCAQRCLAASDKLQRAPRVSPSCCQRLLRPCFVLPVGAVNLSWRGACLCPSLLILIYLNSPCADQWHMHNYCCCHHKNAVRRWGSPRTSDIAAADAKPCLSACSGISSTAKAGKTGPASRRRYP